MQDLGGIVWRASFDTQQLTTGEKKVLQSVDGVERGFNRIEKSGNQLNATMSRVAKAVGSVLAIRQIQRFVLSTAEAIDEQGKFAQQLGVSFTELQKLQFAAEQSGASITTLNNSLRRGRRNIADAAAGTGAAVDALNELNLSAEQLTRLSPDEQFRVLADAISGVEDEARQAAIAYRIFGRDGEMLLNTLRNGRDGLDELGNEAERTGRVLSQETADAAAKFNDELNKLKGAAKGAVVSFGGELLPALSSVFEAFTNFISTGDNVEAIIKMITITAQAAAVLFAGRFVASMIASVRAMQVATVASRTLAASMAFLGGPVGAVVIAAGALAMIAMNTRKADDVMGKHDKTVANLAQSYDKLSKAQLELLNIDIEREAAEIRKEMARITNEGFAEPQSLLTGFDDSGLRSLEGFFGEVEGAFGTAEEQTLKAQAEYDKLKQRLDDLNEAQKKVAETLDDLNNRRVEGNRGTEESTKIITDLARANEELRAELSGTSDELEIQRAIQAAGVEVGSAEANVIRDLIIGNRELAEAIRERAEEERKANEREQLSQDVRSIGVSRQESQLVQLENEALEQLKILNQAFYEEQLISYEEYEMRKAGIAQQYAEHRSEILGQETQSFKDRLEEVGFSFEAMQNQAAGGLAQVLMGFQSGKEAVRQFSQMILTQLIGALIRLGIQSLIGQKAATAAGVATAGTLSAAYATPAALASLMSFGGNAVPAQAGIATTVASTQAMAMGTGRLYGGSTNPGTMYPITEDGRPEVLVENGKQYLLPGARGEVISNRDMRQGSTNNVSIEMPVAVYGDPTEKNLDMLRDSLFDIETELVAAVRSGLAREGRDL